uniref:uncharacterized protein n=1 Tax=Myxine glutinosa TaxID=7769 RepID=UPI00358E1987
MGRYDDCSHVICQASEKPQQQKHNDRQELETTRSGQTLIGDWVILQNIGKGGFGMVFKARNVSSRETVTLKFAKHKAAESAFYNEALMMKRLCHQNI